jgi:tetratricopeptide (TPR) repeat protein
VKAVKQVVSESTLRHTREQGRFAIGIALLVLFGSLTVAGVWYRQGGKPTAGNELVPVNHPDLSHLGPAAQAHAESVRHHCEDALQTNAKPQVRALAYAELGKIYLAYQMPKPASACFANAQSLDPSNFQWPYFLARACKEAGEYEQARDSAELSVRALEADASATNEDRIAGFCFLAEISFRLGDTPSARSALQNALHLAPDCAFALVKLGELASSDGDSERAITLFEKALRLQPGRMSIRAQLAAEFQRRGEVAKAASYGAGVAPVRGEPPILFPDPLYNAVRMMNRSGVWPGIFGLEQLRLGNHRQALKFFSESLAQEPNQPVLRVSYSQSLLALGEIEKARGELEKACLQDPNLIQARSDLYKANALSPATRQQAVDSAEQWFKKEANAFAAAYTLAEVYALVGRYQEAFNAFAAAAKLAPSKPGPRLGQADMLAALGRYEEARQEYADCLRSFPEDAGVRSRFSRLLVACPSEKGRDSKLGLELSQSLFGVQRSVVNGETLAIAFANDGQFEPALERIRQAIADHGAEGDVRIGERLHQVMQALVDHKPYREPWPFANVEATAGTHE